MDGTRFMEILTVIAFFVLLAASFYMLISFYICDSFNCKAFNTAKNKGQPGSKEYVVTLMNEMYNDGIWPVPYIGSAIATPLSLWFLGIPMTVRAFAVMFFVIFVVIYFMFVFFGHHYIRPISGYVSEYIRGDVSKESKEEIIEKTVEEVVCEQVEIEEETDITFATPVNIF